MSKITDELLKTLIEQQKLTNHLLSEAQPRRLEFSITPSGAVAITRNEWSREEFQALVTKLIPNEPKSES